MKILNRKGFTLIEMIIAIAILGIVISLGYGVFNGSKKALSNQNEVFNSQTSMNLINKFLSKDLEISMGISKPLNKNNEEIDDLQSYISNISIDNPIQYSYKVNFDDELKIVIYVVDIEVSEREEYIYNISRIDENNTNIKLLSNKTVFENGYIEIPFTIESEYENDEGESDEEENTTNKGIYDIVISYKDNKKQNKYKFSVKSRMG